MEQICYLKIFLKGRFKCKVGLALVEIFPCVHQMWSGRWMASSQPPKTEAESVPVDPLRANWLIRRVEKGKHSFSSVLKSDFNFETFPLMLQQACIQQGEVSEGLNISPHSITNLLFYCVLSGTRQEGVERTEMEQCGAVLWFWLAAALSVVESETRPIPSIIYQMFLFVSYPDVIFYFLF